MIEDGVLAGKTDSDWMIGSDVTCLLRASALIIKNGCLLAAKSVNYDCYYTVGGGIKINETSEEAVLREVYEETGYNLEIDRLAFIQERFFTIDDRQYHEINFFYLIKESPGMDISNNSGTDLGTETLHWLPLNSLNEVYLVPSFLKTKALNNITALEHIISRE